MTESVSETSADSKGKNTSAEDSTDVTDVEPDDAEPDGDNNDSKQPLEDTDNDPRDEPSTTSTAQGDDDDETEYGKLPRQKSFLEPLINMAWLLL